MSELDGSSGEGAQPGVLGQPGLVALGRDQRALREPAHRTARQSSDRRTVTLRPSHASRIRAREFFDGPADEIHAVLKGFDDEAVRACAQVLTAFVAHLEADNRARADAHGTVQS